MSQTTSAPRGTPLPPEVRARVAQLIRRLGERGAATHLGLSMQTLARVAAGMPCYRGTAALLREKLDVQP